MGAEPGIGGAAAAEENRAARRERDRNMFPFLEENNPIMQLQMAMHM